MRIWELTESRLLSALTISTMTRSDINPVIPGFAPDPSITLIDSKFYLVTSSFHLFPGLPLYVSDDAVHWKHFGMCSNTLSQIEMNHAW